MATISKTIPQPKAATPNLNVESYSMESLKSLSFRASDPARMNTEASKKEKILSIGLAFEFQGERVISSSILVCSYLEQSSQSSVQSAIYNALSPTEVAVADTPTMPLTLETTPSVVFKAAILAAVFAPFEAAANLSKIFPRASAPAILASLIPCFANESAKEAKPAVPPLMRKLPKP
jgi:hypothetical protein